MRKKGLTEQYANIVSDRIVNELANRGKKREQVLSPPCRLPCPKGTDGTIRKHHDRIVNELANLFHLCEIANLKVEDGQILKLV